MNITYTDYLELPAPLAVVREALRDPVTWGLLPIGAERLGEFWQAGGELYAVRCTDSPAGAPPDAGAALGWQIAPVAPGPGIQVLVALYDAVIVTHAIVTLTVDSGSWPWQRRAATRRVAALARSCGAALGELLRDQALQPLDVCAGSLVTPVAVVAGSEASGHNAGAGHWPLAVSPRPLAAGQSHADLVERLRARYPRTIAQFEAMGALDHLERILRLEQGWQRLLSGAYDTACHEEVEATELHDQRAAETAAAAGPPSPAPDEYDLIYAGGGLGLLHAVVMAQRYGWRVLLFDRGEVGTAHREWNISRTELRALVDLGLVTWDELAEVVMREYRNGVVRFYASPYSKRPAAELWMPDVLNVAIDAEALLRLMRRKLEAAGGTILSHRAFRRVRVSRGPQLRVEVELEHAGGKGGIERHRARLLLDGMGSTSPLALLRHAGQPFAGVCPTVGTVARGFVQGDGPRAYDPTVGDILISVSDSQSGQQLIWEGFPGRGNDLTAYLFYYSTLANERQTAADTAPSPSAAHRPASYSLLELFEQYFTLLPTYKEPGPDFRHIRPVYGYIPARHSLRRSEGPLLRGVLGVGDAAAQQSPLTFCGFGSHVRNLDRTTSLLDYALRHNLTEPEHLFQINAFQANVSVNWLFSRFMRPWDQPHNVNELQSIFLGVLSDLDGERATRFYRDQARWSDYLLILWRMWLRFPDIPLIALRVLGVRGISRWLRDYLHFSAVAAVATAGCTLGAGTERVLYALSHRLHPALSLAIRARYAEWRAMGWL